MTETGAPFGQRRKSRRTRGPSISERAGAMDYEAAIATQVADRIGRIRTAVNELQRRSPSTEVRVSSAGGEVVVSVDRHGRLISLKLTSGSTVHFTYEALERLINDTLHAAVELAARPDRQLVSA
ncbi:YbaB/EbfC family nucleoid-associated protein [Mycobacterium sp. RTGN4]|uniref:YbaB/EbfC family nucleoid-associated protein n=1 Tax=unclassified Mycobacterium TaxID=2642494 RepID=UPI0039B046D3